MEIIQIVGNKNSGKTTVATKLIEYLTTNMGLRVASLKHHGHGGIPEGFKDTDSEKHRAAGAFISGVEGDGLFQLSKENWELHEIIEIYKMMHVDILVMEGFKKYSYPKVVLISKEQDLELLKKVDHVVSIISRIPLVEDAYPFPVFQHTEIGQFCEWLKG